MTKTHDTIENLLDDLYDYTQEINKKILKELLNWGIVKVFEERLGETYIIDPEDIVVEVKKHSHDLEVSIYALENEEYVLDLIFGEEGREWTEYLNLWDLIQSVEDYLKKTDQSKYYNQED